MTDAPYDLVWHDAHARGEGLMVLLHGFAEHPMAALLLGSILDPERRYRLCAPAGPLTLGSHKRAFYSSASRMKPDEESFAEATVGVDRAIEAACSKAEVERSDMVLVGFSQGAGLAMVAALRQSEYPPPRALIVFSCRPYPDGLVAWDFAAADGLRMFAGHGTRDRMSPLGELRVLFDAASDHGVDVTWAEHPYGHTLPALTAAAASDWLYGLEGPRGVTG